MTAWPGRTVAGGAVVSVAAPACVRPAPWRALLVVRRALPVACGSARPARPGRRVPGAADVMPADGAGRAEGLAVASAEFVVAHALARRGIETFVPAGSKWVRANRYHRSRKRVVAFAVVPGLVFARLRDEDWAVALRCPMVRGVMAFGPSPARVRDAAIARLREMASDLRACSRTRAMPTNRAYAPGDLVEVLEGAFEGARCRVLAVDGGRAFIEHALLGAPRPVSIALDCVARLG